MKSCKGCRYLFDDRYGDQPASFCRALPPVTRVEKDGGRINVTASYPLAPRIRCGLFKRSLWPWRKAPKVA